MEEIVYRLYNKADEFKEDDDKVEVRHKVVDFQRVSLGEKIRQIYATILENNPTKKNLDIEFLTQTSLKDFEYTFDDLKLA